MKMLIENVASVDEKNLCEKPDHVTDERWKRICRIRPLEDKKRSLLAGRLLHQMCKECGIEEPAYGTVGSGKPVLVSHPKQAFSISHSGEYVVLVYMKNVAAVGVDIQEIRNVSDGVKKRMLHEKECLWLEKKKACYEIGSKTGDAQCQDEMLYLNRIWAIKESYVKMTGEGLSHDFRKLCVDFEQKIVIDEKGNSVSFLELEVPCGYVAAVTIEE